MNKKILALLITFLAPNYNFSSELDQKIQKIEQEIKQNEECHEDVAYLVLLHKEKANLLAFREKLNNYINRSKPITNLSYKPTIDCNICINVSKKDIHNTLLNGSVDDILKKIDDGIRKLEETISTLNKAYTEFKKCILRENNSLNCINNFNKTTPDLRIEIHNQYLNKFAVILFKNKPDNKLCHNCLLNIQGMKYQKRYHLSNGDSLLDHEVLKLHYEKLRKKIAMLKAQKAYHANKTNRSN